MRVTSTNSGADAKGSIRLGRWEFDADAYLYVVAGAVGSVVTFLLAAALPSLPRLGVAALPLVAVLGWVRFFIVNRPPHFCGDFFEGLLVGSRFNLRPQDWTKAAHPRGERVRGETGAGHGDATVA